MIASINNGIYERDQKNVSVYREYYTLSVMI